MEFFYLVTHKGLIFFLTFLYYRYLHLIWIGEKSFGLSQKLICHMILNFESKYFYFGLNLFNFFLDFLEYIYNFKPDTLKP